ncbi:MAG TPA: aminoglycoside phosphotransferase family protein [Deinococcales bacterium]|nr:aminoglycoside phosphotransferase family protein [Deinococcales bacterium]
MPENRDPKLPAFPDLSPAVLQAILRRHGLKGRSVKRLPRVGIFNSVFLAGEDLILRVPRDHPAFTAAAREEAVAIPAARAAGVRTPALVAFDDSRDLLPVPYSIQERVQGQPLGDVDPEAAASVWTEVGRDLARLHAGVRPDGPARDLTLEAWEAPAPSQLEAEGYLTALEARWLDRWLELLRAKAGTPPAPVLRHGDVQAGNVMTLAGSDERAYVAVIDWGACGWGDAASDLAGMPFRAVPAILDGYRAQGGPMDDGFLARVTLAQLKVTMALAARRPQPRLSWAERPIGALVETLRFFLDPRPGWDGLAPPRH